jgi:hypothetical protein
MSDSESIVSILIRFGLLDAQNADTALQKLQLLDEQKRSGIATTMRTVDATHDLGTEEGKALGISEMLHHNHRALHMVFNQIGKESAPELGHALGAALRGPLGIAIAVGIAFETVKKHIEETNKELDAFAELAKARGKTIQEAMRQAFVDVLSEDAAEKLKKSFDTIATGMDRYNTAASQALALQKELRQIELEKTSAADAAATAADDNAVKEGRMSKEQAELNRLNRAAKEETAKVAKEEADRAGDLANKKSEEGRMQSELFYLQQKQKGLTSPDLIGDANKAIAGMPASARKQFADAAAIAPSGVGDFTTEIGRKATEEYLKGQNEVAKNMIGDGGKDGKPGTGLTGAKEKAEKNYEKLSEVAGEDARLLERDRAAGATGSVLGSREFNAEQSEAAAAAAKADLDAANKAISNSNDLILQNELRIASIKTTLDAEKEYREKIEALTKKIGDLQLTIGGMEQINAAKNSGDDSIAGSKSKEQFEKGRKVVESYIPPGAEHGSLDIGGEIGTLVQKHQLQQNQALDIVKYLMEHADKMGQEWNFLHDKIQYLSEHQGA